MQVMLVDDYEIFRKQLRRQKCWRNQSEFVITGEADNGLDALIALRKKPVDILVTDIKMPKLNGLELLERARDEGLCKCVILLSEYADFEYARKGIVLGAFDYIVKPVKDSSFFSVLSRAADYITKLSNAEKAEDETFYERTALVNCIVNGSGNFENAISSLTQKCYASVDHDFVKSGVLLAEAERKIYEAVVRKAKWLSLLVSDIEHICNKIIQSDNFYTISAVFEEFLREMYTTVKAYYPPKMSPLAATVIDYILAHPFEKLTLTCMAENCFVSKAYLSHSFKVDMGKSYVEYVVLLKMQIVKKLLLETDLTMAEIAEKLNYDDYKYMGRLFKNIFGLTPTDYKKMQGTGTTKKPLLD
jgi:two-component system, response regulator YesN